MNEVTVFHKFSLVAEIDGLMFRYMIARVAGVSDGDVRRPQ